ncbi:MAG: J domain-containing protein [Deltaproteobacteria bacterium]|nr:J domain-containing protein [Deltaproteobacteria bacterium]MCB9788336.1 J domain-containing protein [Deltaproteobacteria bacterium]
MGIFDRLSRLARAEVSHLGGRVREALSGDSDDALADDDEVVETSEARAAEARAQAGRASRSAPVDEPSQQRWPREIREAYATLELPLGSSREQARTAYRRLLRTHHPDRHQHDDAAERRATERTMTIRAAWERLDAFLPAD